MSTLRFNTWQNTGGTAATTASEVSAYSFTEPALVFISRTTIGSAVSSVTVSDVFSSAYDTYKIIIQGGAGSEYINIGLKMGSTTTGYYGGLIYQILSTGAVAGVSQLNQASWIYLGQAGPQGISMDALIMSPYLSQPTSAISIQPRLTTTSAAATNSSFTGFLNDTTSYSSFTIATDNGTLTGGTIDVYGYRKS